MTALAALLRDDVVISMPPHDLWLQGIPDVIGWMDGPGHGCAGSKLHPGAGERHRRLRELQAGRPRPLGAVGHPGDRGKDGRISGHHNFLYPELFAELGLPPFLED